MSNDALPPVTKTQFVPLPPERAFALFFQKMNLWWPTATHSVSARTKDLPKRVDVDPRDGGEITEIGPDDESHLWGHFETFEPPHRAVVAWHPGRPLANATTLTITFTETPGGCVLDLTHAGFEVNAEEASMQRDGYDTGWPGVLSALVMAAQSEMAATL